MKAVLPTIMLLLALPTLGQVAGDIVITEVMQNPSIVSDANGEYFEVYNATDHPIDINGWLIQDAGSDAHTIVTGSPLTVAAGRYLVLGRNGDFATNGGVLVDYEYSSVVLGNTDDELIVKTADGVEIDRVEWDGGVTFPSPSGASMMLADLLADNSLGSNWTLSTLAFGDGDKGTPGEANSGTQTLTWDGSTSGAWNLAANWDGNVVPDASKNVVIPDVSAASGNDPAIGDGVAAALNNLTINAGASLSVESGGSLAIFGTSIVNGSCFVTRNMTGGTGVLNSAGYSIAGSPVSGGEIGDFDAQFVFGYTNDSGFSANLNGSVDFLAPGVGYFVGYDAVSPSITFAGTPNAGSITYSVAQTSGFELVANPYTAAISTLAFLADNSSVVTGGVYFWDDGGANVGGSRGGDYIVVSPLGTASSVQPNGMDDGVAGNSGTTAAANGYIPSVQGVFVEVAAAGDITFSPSQITTSSSANADANHYRKSGYQTVKLAMEGRDLYNEILVGFGKGASFDRDYLDARKFETANRLAFYSLLGNEKYAIQALPQIREEDLKVQLGFDVANSGTYSIRVLGIENQPVNMRVYLKDIITGRLYDLQDEPVVHFTSEAVSNDQRFELLFAVDQILSVPEAKGGLNFYGSPSALSIVADIDGLKPITIYGLSGRVVFEGSVDFVEGKAVIQPQLETGKMYILRVDNKSTKFILRK